jgi:hypothetical protein
MLNFAAAFAKVAHPGQGIEEGTRMVAATILLAGLMLLVTQLMILGASGEWPSITLASALGLPADHVYAGAMVVNTAMRFLATEVQLWLVLALGAALVYWLGDFTDEKLARLFGRRRPSEPGPALSQEISPIADTGTQA